MFKRLSDITGFLKGLDKRSKVAISGGGVYNFGQWFVAQYSSLYAQSLGASGSDIGLLKSIASGVKLISSIPLGLATERYTIKRVMLLGFVCDIISTIIFISSGNWWTLVPAFILSGSTFIQIMPLMDIINITVIEPKKRSTIISLSRVFLGALNAFAPLSAAYIVSSFGGINTQGMRPLYYIQLLLYVFVFFYVIKFLGTVSQKRTEETNGLSSQNGALRNYQEFFKDKHLRRWIIVRIVQTFSGSFSAAFIPLWFINVKHASPEIFGVFSTLSMIVSLSLNIPVGRLADKLGRKKTYYLLVPFTWIGGILIVISPNPQWLIISGIIGGGGQALGSGIGGVSNVPFVTMWWEQIPAEMRGRGWGIEGLITSGSAIPASLIAGVLWDQGFQSQVAVLVIPIILTALVVVPLLSTIPDTLGSKK
ncbi:MAG: hypothetical protein QG670_644 [Thermoproteota archaeon]|nr:hypothetical protein [Thermoproteota archaeon]